MAYRRRSAAIVLASALASFASPASAHAAEGLDGGFLAGFLHPLLGLDHTLAMVSVGIWGAFLGRPMIAALPVIFPAVMTLGALLAILNVPLPPVELGIAGSVLGLGLVIAFAYRAPIWIAGGLVGAFGLFHGHAHGTEIPSLADPVAYSTGFVLATGLLHVVGIGLGQTIHLPRGIVAARVGGGLIALCGAYFLITALFG